MTKLATIHDVKNAETKVLVEVYNELTKKSIKKFSSRAAGEKQVWTLIQSQVKQPKVQSTTPAQKITKTQTTTKRDASESRVIEILNPTENPKSPTSRAFKKYGVLLKFNGKTIRDFKAQEGKHPELDSEKGWPSTELRWAVNLGLAKLHKPHD